MLKPATREYLTINEVAERLRVHPASVYRLIHSSGLPAIRLARPAGSLRVPVDDLEQWLDEGRPPT